jgi:hypothetical protein
MNLQQTIADSLKAPARGSHTLSVVDSSALDVVKAVCLFLKALPSEFPSLDEDVLKPDKWQAAGTVFVDFHPIRVEVCLKSTADEIRVVLTDRSLNDIIRFDRVFGQMLDSLREQGLKVAGSQQAVHRRFGAQIVDDDDDFDLSDCEEDWIEQATPVLADIDSVRAEVREEAFRALATWATSSPACHEALAKGFAERADKLLAILCTRAVDMAETYPLVAALRRVAEGASAEARSILSKSVLLDPLDYKSTSRLPTLIAGELKAAMQVLGKASDIGSTEHKDWKREEELLPNKNDILSSESPIGSYSIPGKLESIIELESCETFTI